MKKSILLLLATVLLLSCESNVKQRYTQQSPEIDIYKEVIKAYENQEWETLASHYADTAKIMNNATEKDAQNIAQLIAINKEDAALFSSWDYVEEEADYEMVITDEGRTWVNFWGLWQGTLKANNKMYEIPTSITAQFIDGKIVKEFGYWDVSNLHLDLQALQNTNSTEDESEMDGGTTSDGEGGQ